jgi:flagellar basal-body rod modification protein FlgD
MFLQLLVAQMQNQDPLNPTDSTTFVAQLAQFSDLEQVTAIRSDIEGYMAQSAQNSASSTTPSATSSTTPSTTSGKTSST